MRSIVPRTVAADVSVPLFAVAIGVLFSLIAGCGRPGPTTRPSPLAPPPRYRAIPIPAIPPSYQSFGIAIADKTGNVAGASGFRAASWKRGNTLSPHTVHSNGVARAINADGDVAGWAHFGSKILGFVSHRGGAARDIGALPNDDRSQLNAIAQLSFFAVGFSGGPRGDTAVIFDNGQLIALPKPTPNASCHANGVNDNHVVCGDAAAVGGGKACVWRVMSGQYAIQTLPTPSPWTDARANAISNDDNVVGLAASIQGWQAYLWEPNRRPHQLGTPPPGDSSEATGVANVDNQWQHGLQAVGYLRSPNDTYRAAIWVNGHQYELNQLIPAGTGWQLESANAINEKGEITGHGRLNGVIYQGFILVPVSPSDDR